MYLFLRHLESITYHSLHAQGHQQPNFHDQHMPRIPVRVYLNIVRLERILHDKVTLHVPLAVRLRFPAQRLDFAHDTSPP